MSQPDIDELKQQLAMTEEQLAGMEQTVKAAQTARNGVEDRRNGLKERIRRIEEDRDSAGGLGNGELLASVRAWANILKGRTPPDDREDWAAFDELFERYAKAFCPRFAGQVEDK